MTDRITKLSLVRLKGLIRWALTVLLGCASLFFVFSGFVTGLIAAGGPLNKDRPLWEYQAIVRFSLGMVLWLGSVLVFLLLRRGGVGAVFRGDEISAPKKWFYIVALAISTVAAFLTVVQVIAHTFNR
jgi:hypothetical protein